MKAVLDFKGMENWLEDLAAAGENVDDAVTDLLTETQPFLEDELVANLKKTSEEYTGETASTISTNGVQREGNYVFVETSIGGDTRKEAVVAKEYGNSRQAAEPFFRPTFRSHKLKNKLKEGMKAIMQRFGLSK